MITYKITLENGESQTTQTGHELYCSILDKFNIKYTIEEITTKENDIPHSEVRRMESEGVNEEKFGEPNSSSDSYEHSEYYWDVDRNKDITKSTAVKEPTYFNEEWNSSNTLGNDEVEVRFVIPERNIK